MTIRQRITLLITSAGIAAGVLFSTAVFLELIEQPFRILDGELKEAAYRLAKEKLIAPVKTSDSLSNGNESAIPYWLRVSDSASKQILYESDIARDIPLPLIPPGTRKVVFAVSPEGKNQAKRKIVFRVRAFEMGIDARTVFVQVGRSMENLVAEIDELLLGLLAGFIFSSMALILFSLFVTGKILKPIQDLNELASHISEENLESRIPTDSGRDEFTLLIHTINGMLDRLQFSFERQKRHLADASHELKSPIAMLRLFFEEASQRIDLPEDFQQQMDNQRTNLLRMDRLIKTLLELSILKLESVPPREKIDLVQTVRDVLEDFAPLFDRANIRITLRLPDHLALRGNGDQIRQVLINLLDNAVKYNVSGGRIDLSLWEGDKTIHLELCNTGVGIPKEDLPKVFDQFYRVEKSRSKDYGGVGLGLSIVQEIVRLHTGTISIDSEPGGWTQVNIQFSQVP